MLGNFNDAAFEKDGVRSRFFRKDGKFLVETDGPDGRLATFEVKYTFGLEPLQQYLIEFPDGRVQALTIAWDSRPAKIGGQRWFHLYPDENIRHDDVLHWTKLSQNWNFMCADVDGRAQELMTQPPTASRRPGRDQRRMRGVPRSGLAPRRGRVNSRPGGLGKHADAEMGLVARSLSGATSSVPFRRQWHCGAQPCTAGAAPRGRNLRAMPRAPRPARELGAGAGAFRNAPGLGAQLRTHQADGQMLDEVYNYGSFKQSKMFAAGVTCSDCHEPHGAKLRVGGDGTWLQCHAPGSL